MSATTFSDEELAQLSMAVEGLATLRPHHLSPAKISDDYQRLLATIVALKSRLSDVERERDSMQDEYYELLASVSATPP